MILLPCEITHRELHSKLLLALCISHEYKVPVLVGFDKHFISLSRNLKNCLLVDKSCSSIMWQGRIKPVLDRGGKAIISDEEGFNNLHQSNASMWTARLDRDAANAIDMYSCWGNVDHEFFSRFEYLKHKLEILGNCRSDLLTSNGKAFYSQLSDALKSIFNSYILCVDNFCIEHRDGNYKPPVYARDDWKTIMLELGDNRSKKVITNILLT